VKRCILVFVLFTTPGFVFASEKDILREIRLLREDMNKRFEQVDKRFEQVDKRFEFIQTILVALIAMAIGSPIALEYFARKRAARDEKIAEDTRKIIFALREVAEKDPRLDKALRHAGLL
jgi:hypothetical protein